MLKKSINYFKKDFKNKKSKFVLLLWFFFFVLLLFINNTIYSQQEFDFSEDKHEDDIFWNIFYIVFSENPEIVLSNTLNNFRKENASFVVPLIIKNNKNLLEKIAFYNEEEIYNFLFSYNSYKYKNLKPFVLSLKKLYSNQRNRFLFFENYINKNYQQKINIYPSLFTINENETEFRFNNYLFFSDNCDLKYIFYHLNRVVIKNYFKKISILPRFIAFSKEDREYYKQIFLTEYQREQFEQVLENYLSDFLISKLKIDEKESKYFKFLNNKYGKNSFPYTKEIENRLYFIKFTPYNDILRKWDDIINKYENIPYPRIFGNCVLQLFKERKIKGFKTSEYINLGLKDNVIGVLYFPEFYKNIKKDLKLKSIIKTYLKNIYNLKLIDSNEYENKKSYYYGKKIVKIYFGNDKNNLKLKYNFNVTGDKKKFNFEIFSAYDKEGGIFFSFNNMVSIVFLDFTDNSLFLRMVKDLKEMDTPYKVYKRSFFKKIFDKIIYFFNMLF